MQQRYLLLIMPLSKIHEYKRQKNLIKIHFFKFRNVFLKLSFYILFFNCKDNEKSYISLFVFI